MRGFMTVRKVEKSAQAAKSPFEKSVSKSILSTSAKVVQLYGYPKAPLESQENPKWKSRCKRVNIFHL
jgi:hypothetical protein